MIGRDALNVSENEALDYVPGLFCKPQAFFKSGDHVEVDIDAIGVLRNRIVFD